MSRFVIQLIIIVINCRDSPVVLSCIRLCTGYNKLNVITVNYILYSIARELRISIVNQTSVTPVNCYDSLCYFKCKACRSARMMSRFSHRYCNCNLTCLERLDVTVSVNRGYILVTALKGNCSVGSVYFLISNLKFFTVNNRVLCSGQCESSLDLVDLKFKARCCFFISTDCCYLYCNGCTTNFSTSNRNLSGFLI